MALSCPVVDANFVMSGSSGVNCYTEAEPPFRKDKAIFFFKTNLIFKARKGRKRKEH